MNNIPVPMDLSRGMPHQIKGGQGQAKARVEGMQPNSRKTLNKANRPMSGSATIATNPGTSLGNAEHLSKLGVGKHKCKTIWTKTRTFCTSSKRYTPPTC